MKLPRSTQLFHEVTEALRRSRYLALLPPLEVECAELDGDSNNLPVIYEEHYQDFRTTPLGCGSREHSPPRTKGTCHVALVYMC